MEGSELEAPRGWGLGFGVRVKGLGFMVYGLEFEFEVYGVGLYGLGFMA